MPSQEFETDPPEPEWFPPDKPPPMMDDSETIFGEKLPTARPMRTVIDGTGDIRPMTGVLQPPVAPPVGVLLDPNIALERAMMSMVEVSRRKREDYASSDDEFSNFRATARFAGFEAPWMSALLNVQQKLERIRSLRENGRIDAPNIETVEDTLMDGAVYAMLAYAMFLQDKENDGS